ncbi:MAG: hypothetical protein K0A98_02555 [Trueperaceae bacterium]|nr:hypothetical protein [Trueperaceae bacterium]
MALSRTARILIAILLLAAAAFFWVNFFYQSRLAEVPAQDPVTATPAAPGSDATAEAEAAEGEPEAAGEADAAAEPAVTDPDAIVVAEPEVVAVDPAIAVTRDVVIADLPFLVTEPQAATEEAEAEPEATAVAGVTVPSRATINPFSPVVVRTPPAPARDVPVGSPAAGEVAVEVPVPAGPPPVPTRQAAPTPRAITPGVPSATLSRDLPSGAVLSSAPDLLRQPRVGTVADRVDLPAITVIAVPDPEPAVIEAPSAPRPPAPTVDLEPVGPIAAPAAVAEPEPVVSVQRDDPAAPGEPEAARPAPVASQAPLVAGATGLARFLRDNDYAFTGSVLGPVSVGVFRSTLDAVPIVVSLGQTLPNTEIVLTDLRGMQAELTLGQTTQILTLDLRR